MKRFISLVLTALMVIGLMPMTISVSAADAPSFTVVGIAEGEHFVANTGSDRNVFVTAAAESAAITKVEFLVNNTLLGEDAEAPFVFALPKSATYVSETQTQKLKVRAYSDETTFAEQVIEYYAHFGKVLDSKIEGYDTVNSFDYTTIAAGAPTLGFANHPVTNSRAIKVAGVSGDSITYSMAGSPTVSQVNEGLGVTYFEWDFYLTNDKVESTFTLRKKSSSGGASHMAWLNGKGATKAGNTVSAGAHKFTAFVDHANQRFTAYIDGNIDYNGTYAIIDTSNSKRITHTVNSMFKPKANAEMYIDNFKAIAYQLEDAPMTTATPTIAEGEKISPNKKAYKVEFDNDIIETSVADDALVLMLGSEVIAGTTVTKGSNFITLNIPQNTLEFGEKEYTVKLKDGGVADKYGRYLSGQDFKFKTVMSQADLRPDVELTISDPDVGVNRYLPGTPITLTASAIFEDGEIESIEFKNGDEQITSIPRASLTQSEGTYSCEYNWNAPEAVDADDIYSITAVATYDVDGFEVLGTSNVKEILVLDYQDPTITIDTPAQVYATIDNLKVGSLKVTGTTDDIDGTVETVEVYLNDGGTDTKIGNAVIAADGTYEYIHEGVLEEGDYGVRVTAIDDTDQSANASSSFNVKVVEAKETAFVKDNLSTETALANWSLTGDATITAVTGEGLTLTQNARGDASVTRNVADNTLDEKVWVLKTGVKFGDATQRRTLSIGTQESLTFTESGKIFYGAADTGIAYAADGTIEIEYIANPIGGFAALAINGTTVFENKKLAEDFSEGVQIKLEQTGRVGAEVKAVVTDFAIFDVQIPPNKIVITGMRDGERYIANDGNIRKITVTDTKEIATKFEFKIDGELVHTDSDGSDGFAFTLPSVTTSNEEKTLKVIAYAGDVQSAFVEYKFTIFAGIPGTQNAQQTFDKTPYTISGKDVPNTVTNSGGLLDGNALKISMAGTQENSFARYFVLNDDATEGTLISNISGHQKLVYLSFDIYRESGEQQFTLQLRNSRGNKTFVSIAYSTFNSYIPINSRTNVCFVVDMAATTIVDGFEVAPYALYVNSQEVQRGLTSSGAGVNISKSGTFTLQLLTRDNSTNVYSTWFDNVKGIVYDIAPEFVATPVIEDGATSISYKKTSYKIDFNNDLKPGCTTDSSVVLMKDGEIVPGTTVTEGKNYLVLNIPSETLEVGRVTYTVRIIGGEVCDVYGKALNETDFTFTTVDVGENLSPEVSLEVSAADIAPNRYLPENPIVLTATATDEDGSIKQVNFYKDGALIGSATEPNGEGKFEYSWNALEAADMETLYEITAIAIDNQNAQSESLGQSILVYGIKAPQIDVTVPKKVYASISGVKADSFKISGTTSDVDSELSAMEVLIDGVPVKTYTNPLKGTFEYEHLLALAAGEHTVKISVSDNTPAELGGARTTISAEYVVEVVDATRAEVFQTEDLTVEENKGKWITQSISPYVKVDAERGLVLKQETAGDITISRTINQLNVQNRIWQLDATVKFNTNTHNRKITLATIPLVEFTADGKVTSDGVDTGIKYYADQAYNITAVVNPLSGYMACMLNGTKIYEAKVIDATKFASGGVFSIVQTGVNSTVAETIVKSYGAYNIGKVGTVVMDVKLYEADGTEANTASVSTKPGYIVVKINGEDISNVVDLADCVYVVDTTTGENCEIKFEDGKLKIVDTLFSGNAYEIRVGQNAHNSQGVAYSGTFVLPFTTTSNVVMIDRNTAGFEEQGLAEGTTVNFSANVTNTSGESKLLYVICAVYEGNEMIDKTITEQTVANGGGGISVTSPLLGEITEDTVVEVFVLECLDELTSFTEEIFKLK